MRIGIGLRVFVDEGTDYCIYTNIEIELKN